jgi:GNAT superfamily N-acetyltransferase
MVQRAWPRPSLGAVTLSSFGHSARRCGPKEVRPLRQAVLRPHQSLGEVGFARDERPGTAHFCADDDMGNVIGVATVWEELPPWPLPATLGSPSPGSSVRCWRLRGMATAPGWRRQGVGSALLAAVMRHVASNGGGLLWCNARLGGVGFYERHGLHAIGEPWEEPVIGPHVAMWRPVAGQPL